MAFLLSCAYTLGLYQDPSLLNLKLFFLCALESGAPLSSFFLKKRYINVRMNELWTYYYEYINRTQSV